MIDWLITTFGDFGASLVVLMASYFLVFVVYQLFFR